jgi:hypothetical protein
MVDCDSLIKKEVDALIHAGTLVDMYHLAAALRPECPHLPLQAIARKISKVVARHQCAAVWERPQKPRHG